MIKLVLEIYTMSGLGEFTADVLCLAFWTVGGTCYCRYVWH